MKEVDFRNLLNKAAAAFPSTGRTNPTCHLAVSVLSLVKIPEICMKRRRLKRCYFGTAVDQERRNGH